MTVVSDYRALLSNTSWDTSGAGAAIILTYSFSTAATSYLESTNPAAAATFSAVNASEQATVQAALAQWSAVSGITFEQVTNTPGDLTFGFYTLSDISGTSGEAGLGNFPSAGTYVDANGVPQVYSNFLPEGGDVYFDTSYQTNPAYFSDFIHIALHEIGHAIGLRHPFDAAASGTSYTLTDALDNGSNTVMAYAGIRSTTLEPLDIAAVQYLYGTSTGAAHPFTEVWNQATESLTVTGNGALAQSLFGSGGNDTLYSLGQHDALSGAEGDDTYYLAGRPAGVNGGSGTDTVITGLAYSPGSTPVGGTGTALRYVYLAAYNDFQTYVNVATLDFTNGTYNTATSTFSAYADTLAWTAGGWSLAGGTASATLPATTAADQVALSGSTSAAAPATITTSGSAGSFDVNTGYASISGTYGLSALNIGSVGSAGLTVASGGQVSVAGAAIVKQSSTQVLAGQAALTVAAGGVLQVAALLIQGSGALQYALTGTGGPAVSVASPTVVANVAASVSAGLIVSGPDLYDSTVAAPSDTAAGDTAAADLAPEIAAAPSPDDAPADTSAATTGTTANSNGGDGTASTTPDTPPAAVDLAASAQSLTASPNGGTLEVGSAGNATAGALTIDAGSVLSGSGAIAALVVDNGTIIATGQLALAGGLAGTGIIDIAAGGDAVLTGTLPDAVTFQAATGTLDLLNPTAITQAGAISGFGAGDTIELLSTSAVTTANYVRLSGTNGLLQLYAGSTLVTTLQLNGNYDQSLFQVTAHNGYADVTVTAPDLMFDAAYYLAHNPDVAAAGVDPYQHYMTYGWHEGRDPSAYFDTNYYLTQNPDVKAAGVNPLLHFEQYGWKEGRQPSLVFDDAKYLAVNTDVAAAGVDPLLHYMQFGQNEGRAAFITGGTAAADPAVNATYYDQQLGATLIPAGAAAAQQAAWSYDATGWQRGLNPDAFFNTSYYLSHNPDVAAAHIDPLLHYETFGWKEGRDPSAQFSTSKYLAAYSDVKAAGVDPLIHYLVFGQNEGRQAFSV